MAPFGITKINIATLLQGDVMGAFLKERSQGVDLMCRKVRKLGPFSA